MESIRFTFMMSVIIFFFVSSRGIKNAYNVCVGINRRGFSKDEKQEAIANAVLVSSYSIFYALSVITLLVFLN